jgi:hypothetical protein
VGVCSPAAGAIVAGVSSRLCSGAELKLFEAGRVTSL